jgi:FAD/FMN-containing dehydrogenase
MTDWRQFAAELGDIPVITETALVRQKSRDFYWYSPILKPQLDRKFADLVVCPRTEADVVAVAAQCARWRVPLTARGAGTGNYGQAVPLEGGVVLEMTALDRILALEDGLLTVEPGKKLIDIDAETRSHGWELRMHPSTKRTATIGGFVAGGSGGAGSITWGGLRDAGNVVGARVVSCEPEPRIVTLTGDAVAGVNHAYGTTGIITSLTIAMAPVQPWVDLVAAFDDFDAAARFSLALGLSDGIAKKLVTTVAAPLPEFFRGLDVPAGAHIAIAIVARHGLVAWGDLLRKHGGREVLRVDSDDISNGRAPIYEYTWNHTTLHALRKDKTVTYLQCLYPADRQLQLVADMRAAFPDELMMHLEFIRVGGRVTCSALPVIRFTTAERMAEIVAHHERHGISIANPHFYTLEDGAGHKRVGEGQPALKAEMDPFALLNPGKMRTYEPRIVQDAAAQPAA